jgi:N,N'-diacetyllegionaminate synthase
MSFKNFNQIQKSLLIAEIGNNHEGDLGVAKKMIVLAKKAGADAVKFQTFKLEQFVSIHDKKKFLRYKEAELSFGDFEKLKKYSKSMGLLFISTPLDLESANFLTGIVDVFKISSGDNNWMDLIKIAEKSKKPVIISLGLLDMKKFTTLLSQIKKIFKGSFKNKVALLHCVSDYPPKKNDLNLNFIKNLKKYCKHYGYSDHAIGINASKIAVCFDAKIIEKHFTIDKKFSNFRDHSLSADFYDLKKIREFIDDFYLMKGSGIKKISQSEKKNLQNFRRSIALREDLSLNSIVVKNDISFLRPGFGISPNQKNKVLGMQLNRHLKKHEVLKFSHFKKNNK